MAYNNITTTTVPAPFDMTYIFPRWGKAEANISNYKFNFISGAGITAVHNTPKRGSLVVCGAFDGVCTLFNNVTHPFGDESASAKSGLADPHVKVGVVIGVSYNGISYTEDGYTFTADGGIITVAFGGFDNPWYDDRTTLILAGIVTPTSFGDLLSQPDNGYGYPARFNYNPGIPYPGVSETTGSPIIATYFN